MSQTVTLGDQQITIQDFNALKFFEAMDLVGQIMEVVPQADELMSRYTKEWLAANGAVQEVDRAAARWLFGQGENGRKALESITDAEWEASGQKLRLDKAPDGNSAFLRAFPVVYKHARTQAENLLCLLATPNSKLQDADEAGALGSKLYEKGGAVYETRKLVLHRAKLSQQVSLALACMRQLIDEFRESDLEAQMRDFRQAATELRKALAGESDDKSSTPDDAEPDEKADTSPAPSSSTPSSPATPASPEPTSSTASPTAS
jgi:hypothetical protein